MAYVKKNYEHNGLEIYFDSKPSKSILSNLKDNRWRWHSGKKCWYNFDTESNEGFANKICEEANKKFTSDDIHMEELLLTIGDYVEFESKYFGTKHGSITHVNYLNSTADIEYLHISVLDRKEHKYTDTGISWKVIKKCEIGSSHISADKTQTHEKTFLEEYGFQIGDQVEMSINGYEATGKIIGTTFPFGYEATVSYSFYDEEGKKHKGTSDVEPFQLSKYYGYKKYQYNNLPIEKQKEIEYNDAIKKRITNKTDDFPEALISQNNNELYKHQRAGCLLAEKYNKFAFFYDTGTGKTAMALDIIHTKQAKNNTKFLIIAPKAIIRTAWMEDAERFYPDVHILPLSKGFSKYDKRILLTRWKNQEKEIEEKDIIRKNTTNGYVKLLAAITGRTFTNKQEEADDRSLEDMAQHYIINAEMFMRDPYKYTTALGVGGIIVDESAILKNHNGKLSQLIYEVCKNMDFVYLLSGKPAPNNEMEFFPQMRIVDPELSEVSYYKFASDFGVDPNVRNTVLTSEARNTLSKLISSRSLIISKEDCIDLPDTIDVIRQFELPTDTMNEYIRLLTHSLAIIKGMDNSSRLYSTNAKMAILMKLRQMTSGFFIIERNGNKTEKEIVPVHEKKIEELNATIDEIGDYQVIIWCQFRYEIERVAEELSHRGTVVTAYGGTKNLDKSISDFKKGTAKYIVAHPKTLKYGVTFTNCQYMIYYSFSYSAEDYDQSHDRIYRLGQKNRCTFIFLQAEDTIDELMYKKVMNKLSNAEFFEQLIKNASKHGIDYSSLKEAEEYSIDFIKEIENEKERVIEKTSYPDFYDFPYREPTDRELMLLEECMNNHPYSFKRIDETKYVWQDDCYWDMYLDYLDIWNVDYSIDIPESETFSGKKSNEEISEFATRQSAVNNSLQELEAYMECKMDVLSEREYKVLQMRFGLAAGMRQMTLYEVGYEMRVTRERIRQIEVKAIMRLRRRYKGFFYLGQLYEDSEDGVINWNDPLLQ